MIAEEMSREAFMGLGRREVADVLRKTGHPSTVVLVPDNTRRTGILYKGIKTDSRYFEKDLFNALNSPFIGLVKTIFDHGIRNLFIPSLTHGNLGRSRKYVDAHLKYATRLILREERWMSFYEENGVRVRLYGDRDYIEGMGYRDFPRWAEEVEEATAHNGEHTLFWGYACSASVEYMRIMNLCVDFYEREGRRPSIQELRDMYYGVTVGDVDIFIRPGEIRDSDCQPPLISGNAQMYFPVSPLTELEDGFFKEILYDYLFCRVRSGGRKEYLGQADASELRRIRGFYEQNRGTIIGLGERMGDFWVPSRRSGARHPVDEVKTWT
jgi:undecaprenyl pyrophosphate synthase